MTEKPEQLVPSDRNPLNGRWLPGVRGTGRRPRIDLLSVCDRLAREEGLDLETLVWAMVKGLILTGSKGDVPAAREVLRYLCKDPGNSDGVTVNVGVGVDARTTVANVGPTLPDAERFAGFLDNLGDFTARLRELRPDMNAKPKTRADELLS